MSTVVRIIPMTNAYGWDTAINFDESEVRNCIVSLSEGNIIQLSQKTPPRIVDVSKANSSTSVSDRIIINLEIYHKYGVTETKLDTIYEYNLLYRVYYKYLEFPSVYKSCILDPNRVKRYRFGMVEIITTKLIFYESYESP